MSLLQALPRVHLRRCASRHARLSLCRLDRTCARSSMTKSRDSCRRVATATRSVAAAMRTTTASARTRRKSVSGAAEESGTGQNSCSTRVEEEEDDLRKTHERSKRTDPRFRMDARMTRYEKRQGAAADRSRTNAEATTRRQTTRYNKSRDVVRRGAAQVVVHLGTLRTRCPARTTCKRSRRRSRSETVEWPSLCVDRTE